MATNTKAPTKAEIENELKNVKNSLKQNEEALKEKENVLQETQNALKDAMELIQQLKEQVNQQPQVVVQNDNKAMSKIKCINIAHNPVNIATMPNGQGRVFTFREYGQVQYIRYDELLDIISAYPNTMESGIIYIADRNFCKEQGLYNDDDVIYTKEVMDKIVYLREDIDVDMLCNMSKPLLESTIREIAELYNKGEEMEANKLERIKKELGFDIVKLADDIKVLSAEDQYVLNYTIRYMNNLVEKMNQIDSNALEKPFRHIRKDYVSLVDAHKKSIIKVQNKLLPKELEKPKEKWF